MIGFAPIYRYLVFFLVQLHVLYLFLYAFALFAFALLYCFGRNYLLIMSGFEGGKIIELSIVTASKRNKVY